MNEDPDLIATLVDVISLHDRETQAAAKKGR